MKRFVAFILLCLAVQACEGRPRPTPTPAVIGMMLNGVSFASGANLTLSKSYTVATTGNSNTKSVQFIRDGITVRIDSVAPFNFTWSPTSLGAHTFAVVPCSALNGTGTKGSKVTRSFNVVKRTPTPTATPSPTPSPTQTPVPTPATPTPTPTATATPTPSPTPTSTVTPSATPTATPTPVPTPTPTDTPTPTPTETPTPSPSVSPTPSPTPTATPIQKKSAHVSWSASPSSGVTGYIVVWGTESGNYTDSFDCGNELAAFLIGKFDAGTTYYAAVKAYNATKVGVPSTEAAFTPDETWSTKRPHKIKIDDKKKRN